MTKTNKTKRLAVNAVMTAVVILFTFVPIKTAGLEITLAMIPIAVGAVCFGEYTGLLLGTVCGVCSFLQCVGFLVPSAFGAALFEISPFYTFLVCVPTRMLAGYLTGLIFKLTGKRNITVGCTVASLACPLLNTLLFMGTLAILFFNTAPVQAIANGLGVTNPLVFIVVFIWVNSLAELLANFIIALPCSRTLIKAFKKMG